ncbi:uncharacterized protein BXZ73DRAFT_23077, partial [Epithele typhae]|uniref:uncharacterized protein n=1 Tax=Epithele typhae TaxID=378194 RepID=UPI00200885E0
IEDKRVPNAEGELAEIRVPLKPAEGPDGGFWADAAEVAKELQNSPSRIDGRAKIYTLRGKFKQYFLRLPTEGEKDLKTANLKVTADRTLEVYVEDVS